MVPWQQPVSKADVIGLATVASMPKPGLAADCFDEEVIGLATATVMPKSCFNEKVIGSPCSRNVETLPAWATFIQ